MRYRLGLFASMARGPLVALAPEDDEGHEDAPQAEGASDSDGGQPGEAQEGDPAPAAAADPAPEPDPPKPARTPWHVKRIDRLTAEARAAQEERDRLAQENAELRRRTAAHEALYGTDTPAAGGDPAPAAADPPAGGKKTYTEDEFNAELSRRSSITKLNQTLDQQYDQAAATYGDEFSKRVKQAGQAFPDLGSRVDFFTAISKLPNGGDVYHNLTGDLDRMAEVLELSPLELGMELTRMSTDLNGKKPAGAAVSRVPAPIVPVDEGGQPVPKGDEMSSYAKDFDERQKRRREARGY